MSLVEESGKVLEEWAEWIAGGWRWDWFATLTFSPPDGGSLGHTTVGWSLSDRRFRTFVEHLEDEAGPGSVYWMRAREPHQFSAGTHFHALIGGVAQLRRTDAWRWWFERNGQARILPADADPDTGEVVGNRLAVCRYVVKYCLKQNGEVVFSDTMSAARRAPGRTRLWRL